MGANRLIIVVAFSTLLLSISHQLSSCAVCVQFPSVSTPRGLLFPTTVNAKCPNGTGRGCPWARVRATGHRLRLRLRLRLRGKQMWQVRSKHRPRRHKRTPTEEVSACHLRVLPIRSRCMHISLLPTSQSPPASTTAPPPLSFLSPQQAQRHGALSSHLLPAQYGERRRPDQVDPASAPASGSYSEPIQFLR